jgi:hypothetical protein
MQQLQQLLDYENHAKVAATEDVMVLLKKSHERQN